MRQSDRFNGHILNSGNNFLGLVGQIIEITDESGIGLGYYRTIVREQDAEMMSLEMQQGYSDKAFLSWDGLFRPISTSKIGTLPRYAICETFDDCTGCSGVSPNTMLLTIDGTTADVSGLVDINGTYSLSRISGCVWQDNAALDLEIRYTGTGWILSLNGDTSQETSGVVECTDSENPTPFTWGASLPSGYSGGSYRFAGYNQLTIHDLQPWQNPSGMQWDYVNANRSNTINIGHDLEVAARSGSDRNGTPSGGLGFYQSGYTYGNTNANAFDYRDDYRVIALKGPVVVHGWGYDQNGRPVPNLGDNEAAASTGIFTQDGLHDTKFLEGHLRKPYTWPVGPIDLRWNREKCLWNIYNNKETILSSLNAIIPVPSGYASKDCFCSIIDGVETLVDELGSNGTLNASGMATMTSGIATAREICDCVATFAQVGCLACDGDAAAENYAMELTGFSFYSDDIDIQNHLNNFLSTLPNIATSSIFGCAGCGGDDGTSCAVTSNPSLSTTILNNTGVIATGTDEMLVAVEAYFDEGVPSLITANIGIRYQRSGSLAFDNFIFNINLNATTLIGSPDHDCLTAITLSFPDAVTQSVTDGLSFNPEPFTTMTTSGAALVLDPV